MLFCTNKQSTPFSELKNNLNNSSYDAPLSSIYGGSLVIRNGGYEFRPYCEMSHYQNKNLSAILYRSHWNKTIHDTQLRDWDDVTPEEVIGDMNDMVDCITSGR
jgi:hypothetical protein